MPNHVECDLYVEGPPEQLRAFLQQMKSDESELDFNRLIPYPEKYKKLDDIAAQWDESHKYDTTIPRQQRPKDGYNQGGYEWCIEHWGTKWNSYKVSVTEDACDLVEINFRTAWSPPKPVIAKASKLFSELTFDLRYFDGGARFHGQFVCQGGDVTMDEEGKYFGKRGG